MRTHAMALLSTCVLHHRPGAVFAAVTHADPTCPLALQAGATTLDAATLDAVQSLTSCGRCCTSSSGAAVETAWDLFFAPARLNATDPGPHLADPFAVDPSRPDACCAPAIRHRAELFADPALAPWATTARAMLRAHNHHLLAAATARRAPSAHLLVTTALTLLSTQAGTAQYDAGLTLVRLHAWAGDGGHHHRGLLLYPLPLRTATTLARTLSGTVLPIDAVDATSWPLLSAMVADSLAPATDRRPRQGDWARMQQELWPALPDMAAVARAAMH